MDKRNALRTGAVSAAAMLVTLLPSPAFALIREDGDDPGPGLNVAQTIGLYVVIPLAVFGLISLLVWLPSMRNRKKSD